MLLSAQSIRHRCQDFPNGPMIAPYQDHQSKFAGMSYGLSAAGYDVRIHGNLTIPPKGFALASTLEWFLIPDDLVMRVVGKSTWERLGLAVHNTVAEPGWYGWLTLELTNHTAAEIVIERGTPIAQMQFEMLDFATDRPYRGKYMNQPNRPVHAILET